MDINKKALLNLATIGLLLIIIFVAINNLTVNLIRTDVGINFNWLSSASGFTFSESVLPFKSSDNYLWAIISGWLNTLKVVIYGLLISTFIGTTVAIARIGSNKLVSRLASLYVAIIRQTPLLLQLLFWYFVVLLSLPETPIEILYPLIILSNKGIAIFGANLSSEFSALVLGLSLFTGASISEVIRGGLNSVDKGQIEAYRSLGVNESTGINQIIIPQALTSIIPGLTSQYLNLAKNSTLAIAIGYPDIYAISDTTITQTGRAIEGFLIILVSFLTLNLLINSLMNTINNSFLKINKSKL